MNTYICEYCHKQHTGSHTKKYCSRACGSKGRKRNRARTIAKKKRQGVYKKSYTPTMSKLQKGVASLLLNAGYNIQVQHRIGKYYYDIRFGNIIIEVNGDYWHANPEYYSAHTIIRYPGNKKKSAATVWKRDLKKKLQANRQGYRVVYIWQSQIKCVQQSKLLLIIQNKIKQENHLK